MLLRLVLRLDAVDLRLHLICGIQMYLCRLTVFQDLYLGLSRKVKVIVVLADLQQFLVGRQLLRRDLAVKSGGLDGIGGLVPNVLCHLIQLVEKCHFNTPFILIKIF